MKVSPDFRLSNNGKNRRSTLPAVIAASTLLVGVVSACGETSKPSPTNIRANEEAPVSSIRVQTAAKHIQKVIDRIRRTTPQTQELIKRGCKPSYGPGGNTPHDSAISTYTVIASADGKGGYILGTRELPDSHGKADASQLEGVSVGRVQFNGCSINQPYESILFAKNRGATERSSPSGGWIIEGADSHNDVTAEVVYSTLANSDQTGLTKPVFYKFTREVYSVLDDAAHRAPVNKVQLPQVVG